MSQNVTSAAGDDAVPRFQSKSIGETESRARVIVSLHGAGRIDPPQWWFRPYLTPPVNTTVGSGSPHLRLSAIAAPQRELDEQE